MIDQAFWANKRVLVTGVCGTVGGELLRQLMATSVAEIIGIDHNESDLFFLEQRCQGDDRVRLYLGDIRDRDQLIDRMRGIDIVLHAAALKHVGLCERSPRDAIATNILGTENIIEAAIANQVGRVLFTSSDKAVNPTNVMGTSKLMGERLMTSANARRPEGGTVFASTRFGNVLGSRGSVIPVFRRQIAAGGPVTLTDPEMTRFIMTLGEAVRLVMDSAMIARGGEVFVTKMPVARIADLARVMIDTLGPCHGHDPAKIAVQEIGAKPGEKLYEELMNEEEVRRTVELSQYFAVKPAFRADYQDIRYDYPGETPQPCAKAYNSSLEPAMSRADLTDYMTRSGLLNDEAE
ncbi:polysaccharide biosynthesis protein [Rhodothalassium salexigens DSM 2132]|uniref:Polysaccharide biosynthesis protein n=1 Tax=Rhodothalassium salexigens DSM 2132 TaxID=1188247 RepID=A0A4R2PIJ9_RHOSA|nr:SDR family NAD(P)-dependent oxidoreductase [Rhodothalassium salexigens]MBB4211369.1 FlaA1/EpsC-like NDP-sugar epimerase [Rhodothalassium salexigens DSM 2132]MBK1637703.1 capsule biosynthesis protein CapD [Rhodothalassium salexigens DSM 2132]TCP35290.1 polysaccharide biosynthesis protein [Rhodothalassium salexigens DSM 2132]